MSAAFVSALIVVSLAAAQPVPAPATKIEALVWLSGCWARTDADAGSGEQWTAPAGGTMLGLSRTVRDGRTTAHEFVLIRPGADGTLVYFAQPSGQAPAEFRLVYSEAHAVVFENTQHDFPQRIGYRRRGELLLAWIEGTRDGRERRAEFAMRRSNCESTDAPR